MKQSAKQYKCTRCGHVVTQTTNHYGSTWSFGHYNTCPNCPPWAKYPEFGGQTVWECMEEEPKAKEMNRKQQAIAELTEEIKAAGFRAFVSFNGEYGFFTDAEGSRVISFQIDYFNATFSGNYKTDRPAQTGKGWGIWSDGVCPLTIKEIFNATPPQWAVRDAKWRFTTLAEYLADYQQSSKFVEV